MTFTAMRPDFHGDAAGFRGRELAAGGAVEAGPGVGVDLGFQGGFQFLIGVLAAEEIGLTDEEAVGVVVGIDEPAGDVVLDLAGAADFAGGGVEDIDAAEVDRADAVLGAVARDVGFGGHDEQVAAAGFAGFCGVAFLAHAGFQHDKAAEVHRGLAHLRVEGEAADGQGVGPVAAFAGGFADHFLADGAAFGADDDDGALLLVGFLVGGFGGDVALASGGWCLRNPVTGPTRVVPAQQTLVTDLGKV